jgi:hypothetical protein
VQRATHNQKRVIPNGCEGPRASSCRPRVILIDGYPYVKSLAVEPALSKRSESNGRLGTTARERSVLASDFCFHLSFNAFRLSA